MKYTYETIETDDKECHLRHFQGTLEFRGDIHTEAPKRCTGLLLMIIFYYAFNATSILKVFTSFVDEYADCNDDGREDIKESVGLAEGFLRLLTPLMQCHDDWLPTLKHRLLDWLLLLTFNASSFVDPCITLKKNFLFEGLFLNVFMLNLK